MLWVSCFLGVLLLFVAFDGYRFTKGTAGGRPVGVLEKVYVFLGELSLWLLLATPSD